MDSGSHNSDYYIRDVKSGVKITWVGMVVNIFLVIIKVVIGIIAKSQALIADGIHSLSDLFSDIVVLFGLKWGRKEEDEDHPYGHGRIETISSMLVGLLLILVGFGLVFDSFQSIYNHKDTAPGGLAIFAALISVILKEILYWYTVKIGRSIKSLAIIGNAWHHRTDALSSVAVLIGVMAAYFNPAWHIADAYAELIVTIFILKVGKDLMWSAIKEVIDTAPDKKILKQLELTAIEIDDVLEAHDIRARYSGGQIFVEIHIVVDPELTVRQGHEIAKKVEKALLREVDEVTRVIVHIDPEFKTNG